MDFIKNWSIFGELMNLKMYKYEDLYYNEGNREKPLWQPKKIKFQIGIN